MNYNNMVCRWYVNIEDRATRKMVAMNIAGEQVWITGGGSGLGLACARRFASHGGKVTIFDLDDAAARGEAAKIGASVVKVDVADETSVASAVDATVGKTGAPRVLVNCAGIGLAARIVGREGKLSTDVFTKTIHINLVGTYLMMSRCALALLVVWVAALCAVTASVSTLFAQSVLTPPQNRC